MNRSPDIESDASENARIHLLRTHVEREVRRPAVIMVTSATAGDGKSFTAHALAQCLAKSGRRTALVDASTKPGRGAYWVCPEIPGETGDLPDIVSMPEPQPGRVREAIAQFVESSRSSHDYTIVDTSPLLEGALPLALAGCVDGVLVAVRIGRTPSQDDEAMMRVLEQSGGRVLGVVATSPESIADFAKLHMSLSSSPARDRGALAAASTLPAMQPQPRLLVTLAVLLVASFIVFSKMKAPALTTHLPADLSSRPQSFHAPSVRT
jgi:hypothetical protein